MSVELLEPCCYTKQFNAALSESRADVINLFHSGDVDVVRFLDRVSANAVADSTLWVVLPHFAIYTVEALQKIIGYLRYSEGKSSLCFPVVNILVREVTPELQALKPRDGQVINIATDKQLGMRIVGFTAPDGTSCSSQGSALFISGSLIQAIQFGAHMVTVHRGREQASMITPYLSRQIRFHKALEIKNSQS